MRRAALSPAGMHAGPNMTPLVDVVMVILIFLMLAGSFGIQERYIESKLPATASTHPPADGPITGAVNQLDIHVSRSATGFDVIRLSGGETFPGPEPLLAALKARRAEYAAAGIADEMSVVIFPGVDTPWELVIGTYDAALRAGFEKVNFAYAE